MSSQSDITRAFGLVELSPGENATVDIVALHGLGGHRETSWAASNGTFWLRDLLPARIPNARIFSYGYDSNTHGQDQLSTATIHDHGRNLISRLASKRRDTSTEDRPIIFVAHSLGGIVLKSALIYANSCSKDHLPDHKAVEVSTSGILYFGTPHQGSETASLATVMLNVLSAFGKGTAEIVKDLQPNSDMLQQQLAQYQAISSRFSTKFYFESYETPIGLVKKLLVPRHSAVVPGAVNAESVPLNKNHIDLVKFESAADDDFDLVASHLSTMADDAPGRIMDRWKSQKRVDGVTPIEELAPLPQLPYQEGGESFVGRAQALNWIHESFKNHHKLVLYGIGGIGKTAIAVEYVYTHRRDYDIIFWVNGDTLESTTSGFIEIAQRLVRWRSYASAIAGVRNYPQTSFELGLDDFVDSKGNVSNKTEHRADIVNAVKESLARPQSGTWLLIFDNVDDLDSFDLTNFFPTPTIGRILITSKKLESSSLGNDYYEVPALSEDDSVQLLVTKSRRGEADNAAYEIVRRLEGLPLAIELVAAYIVALQFSYQSYLEISKESWKTVFKRNAKHYGRSLVAMCEFSYQAISSRSPSAAKLLLWCAFVNNEEIPEQLFRGKLGATLNEALEQIFAFSLAKRSPARPSSFSIHSLIHEWARERLDEEQKAGIVTEMVILLGDAISQEHISLGHISTCATHALEHCLPKLHGESDISIFQSLESIAECERGPLLQGMLLLALQATESVEDPDSVQTFTAMILLGRAYLGHPHLEAGKFLRKALQHQQHLQERLGPRIQQSSVDGAGSGMLKHTEQEQSREAEQLFRRSLEGFEKILGLDHASTLSATFYLARSLCQQGRFEEGLQLEQRALEGRERILGPDHPSTVDSIHYIAITLTELNRFGEAEKMNRHALENIERAVGLDNFCGRHILNHLAITLAKRRFEEAETISRRALESCERTLGLDDPDTLHSVSNLAFILNTLGRFEEAEKMGQRALEGRKRSLGSDHPDTLLSMNHLANTLGDLGRLEEAEQMHRCVLKKCEATQGLGHHDTLGSVHNLAILSAQLGRFEEAEKMHRRALESRERTLGWDHPDTLNSVHKLAITLNTLHRFEEAEKVGRRALESHERTLGLDHPETLLSVNHLASSLEGLGRFEEAEKMVRRTLEGRERNLGLDHPETLGTAHNLAILLGRLGQFEEAEKMDRRALEGRERTLGLDDPDTLKSLHNLAITLGKLGRFDDAEKLERRAFESHEKTLGLDHRQTLHSADHLAASLHQLNRFDDAELLLRRVLESREKTLGLNHPATINTVSNLVIMLNALRRFDEAEKICRCALESRESTLGLEHTDTLLSVRHLAIILHNLGRFEEAEKMFRRALENREKDLGLNHPDTLDNAHHLATTLSTLHRFDEAEKICRRVLESRENTLGLEHPDTLLSVHHLAIILRNLGRFEEAEKMFRRALENHERTLGLNHPKTLKNVHHLATTLWNLGQFEESEKVFRRPLEHCERTLGLDHPDTLDRATTLAFSLLQLNQSEKAEKIFRRVLESRDRTLGLDHTDTLRSVNNLALSLMPLRRFEEAEELFRRALESYERTLGLDHDNTISIASNLATLLEYKEAKRETLLDGLRKALGFNPSVHI